MKASEIKVWPNSLQPHEFPEGVLEFLDARVLEEIIFPLRAQTNVPMSPSGLPRAHVRHDAPAKNMHSTDNQTRNSFATDFQVKTYQRMLTCFWQARQLKAVGGLGIYFNLKRPTFHVDLLAERGSKLTWLVTHPAEGEEYIYLENDPVRFFRVLGEQLTKYSK